MAAGPAAADGITEAEGDCHTRRSSCALPSGYFDSSADDQPEFGPTQEASIVHTGPPAQRSPATARQARPRRGKRDEHAQREKKKARAEMQTAPPLRPLFLIHTPPQAGGPSPCSFVRRHGPLRLQRTTAPTVLRNASVPPSSVAPFREPREPQQAMQALNEPRNPASPWRTQAEGPPARRRHVPAAE